MEASQLRFPRLNLARSGATELAVFGIYELNDERVELLPDEVPSPHGTRSRGFVSYTRYKSRGASGRTYRIVVGSHVDVESNEIHVSISYREVADATPARRSRGVPEAEAIGIIRTMGVPKESGGFVQFAFENRLPHQLWFPLPTTLAGKLPQDTIELRGVRGAKLGVGGAETAYDFILDRPRDDEVLLLVEMGLDGVMTSEVPSMLLARAEAASRELVEQS